MTYDLGHQVELRVPIVDQLPVIDLGAALWDLTGGHGWKPSTLVPRAPVLQGRLPSSFTKRRAALQCLRGKTNSFFTVCQKLSAMALS